MMTRWLLLGWLCAALVGCSKPESPPRVSMPSANPPSPSDAAPPATRSDAAPAKEPPAVPAVGTTTPPAASPGGKLTVRKVSVQAENSSQGVAAVINRVEPNAQHVFFSETDASGVTTPNQPCEPQDRFEVLPNLTDAYQTTKLQPCAETIQFVLLRARDTYALILLGNDALKANDFGKAQHYFASAAARFEGTSPAEALVADNQAKIAAGKALGIAQPTLHVNGQEMFTAAATAKLRVFQASHGLPSTGELDPATQRALSGLSSNDLLQQAAKVPPMRLERYKIDLSPFVTTNERAKADMMNKAGIAENPLPLAPKYDVKAMTAIQKGKVLDASKTSSLQK